MGKIHQTQHIKQYKKEKKGDGQDTKSRKCFLIESPEDIILEMILLVNGFDMDSRVLGYK